jgi:anti-sigma regulatory factor (Ser/Thr protein kinase)
MHCQPQGFWPAHAWVQGQYALRAGPDVTEVRFQVRATPDAVSQARHSIRALGALPDHVLLDAQLVVSELVTNSLLHAGLSADDVIDVALRRDEQHVEIEVDDRDGLNGELGRHPPARRTGGMGLKVLDALCNHWHAEAGRVIASLRV